MKSKTLPSVNTIPPEILQILGPPPILSSEDEGIYHAMLERFAKDIAPSDIIAWLLIKDLVDYRLEIARCRRIKVAVIREAYESRIQRKISSHYHQKELELHELHELIDKGFRGAENSGRYDEKEIRELKAEIEARFQEEAAAQRSASNTLYTAWRDSRRENEFAISLPYWIEHHEKIDQLLDNTERKFHGTLREIERHIAGFSKALREDLKIIQGEVLGGTERSLLPAKRGAEQMNVSGVLPNRLRGSLEPVRTRGVKHGVASSNSSKPKKRASEHRPKDSGRQAEIKSECVPTRA